LRIGWAITRDAVLREHLMTAKFNTVISCSPVDEALALDVLSRHDRIIGERRQRLAENLALTTEWVRRNAAQVEWVPPDAGALCCVRLRPSVFDDAAVEGFYAALARQGVRVGQGRWFGDAARVFRLGFGLPTSDDLGSAFECMSAALRQAAPAAGESGRLS
jgi:DNA-binding transcriptional MocR family regulator